MGHLSEIDDIKRVLLTKEWVPYNVLALLERHKEAVFWQHDAGALVVKNGYFLCLTGCADTLKDYLQTLEPGHYGFQGVESDLANSLMEGEMVEWIEPCQRFLWSGQEPDVSSPYKIQPVALEDAQAINDRYPYRDETSLQRIQEAIRRGPSAAIYIENALASYVLVHEDDSIGFMHTLEAFRRLNLAYYVTQAIVSEMLKLGRVPYVEIATDNMASQRLAIKAGFVPERLVTWFGLIKGVPTYLEKLAYAFDEPLQFVSSSHVRLGFLTKESQALEVTQDPSGKIELTGQKDQSMIKVHMTALERDILKVDSVDGAPLSDWVVEIANLWPEREWMMVTPFDQTLVDHYGFRSINCTSNGGKL